MHVFVIVLLLPIGKVPVWLAKQADTFSSIQVLSDCMIHSIIMPLNISM